MGGPSSQPVPKPQPVPSSGNPAVDQLAQVFANQNVGSSSSTSTGDLYGLGSWGAQKINPGALPVLAGVIATGQGTTGDSILKAFAAGDPASVAQIQRALYLGGYYSKTYTPTYGVVKPEDISAFGSAVTVAGQTQNSVADVLLQGAQYGTISGVAAARAQRSAAKSAVATVTLPNTDDLEAEAVKAFNATLGRNANPKEAAAFAAAYRAMSAGVQRANNQATYDAQYGNTQGPGLSGKQAADLTKSAENVAQPQLTPYKGPEQQYQGDFVTPDGELVGYRPIAGNSRLGPQIGATQGTQLVGVDPNGPGYGQPYDPTPSFSLQMASLGAVAQQAQSDATPQTGGGLTDVPQESVEDPTVAAENFAQHTAPRRAAAHSMAAQFDNLLNILSSSFGGA